MLYILEMLYYIIYYILCMKCLFVARQRESGEAVCALRNCKVGLVQESPPPNT